MREYLLHVFRAVVAAGGVIVLCACAPAQTTSGRLSKEIDSYLLQLTQQQLFSGAVLVAKEGEIVLERGYGFADCEKRIRNTPATQFRLASTSKLMTRVAVLLEEERGALDVKQRLSAFLPEYPDGDKITLANLINHTSGIPDLFGEPRYSSASAFMEPITVNELVGLFSERSLAFEPGTRVLYSSPGYVLLAHVTEKTSGVPFGEYLKAHVFTPLGMTGAGHLGCHDPDQPATGYELQNGDLASTGEMDPTYFMGSGGVFAGVRDLYRFFQALYEEGFLSERSMREFGAGRHSGRIWGFRSGFEVMPSRGVVVIVLSNFLHAPIEEIMPEIMSILLEDDVSRLPVEEQAVCVGRYWAPDFDRIEREIRVMPGVDGLGLSILDSSGDVLEMTLHPWVKDRYFTKRDGRFTGITVAFERDSTSRVVGVTLDVYGLRIHAERQDD